MPSQAVRAFAPGWAVLLAVVGTASALRAQPAASPAIGTRFELNDAQVKGRALEGVAISVSPAAGGGEVASGRTDSDGRWTARLPSGTYQVRYRLDGYVPYTSGATEISGEGQLVTVSLSRLLEATESGGREVRIILNWGSRPDQVKDADSHLACPCGASDRPRLLSGARRTRPRATGSRWTWTTPTGAARRRSRSPVPRRGRTCTGSTTTAGRRRRSAPPTSSSAS